MYIRCIVKPVYDSQHRDAGKESLINIEAVDYFNVEYDNCIYAYTKNGERYLVSYYAGMESSDGTTVFDTLCTAVHQGWPIFCGHTERIEFDKLDEERLKAHLSEFGKEISKDDDKPPF
jgi:hypothetical protein